LAGRLAPSAGIVLENPGVHLQWIERFLDSLSLDGKLLHPGTDEDAQAREDHLSTELANYSSEARKSLQVAEKRPSSL